MKRLSFKLMQWIQSFFKKKKNKEVKSPEIGTFDTSHLVFESLNSDKDIKDDFNVFSQIKNDDLSKKQKKKVLKDFNKSNDHKEILKVTVRDKKPIPYDASKNVVFGCSLGKFNVTVKQEFFLNKIKELDYQKDGANGNDVCRLFIEQKYGKIDSSIPERHLKQDYHRSTFKYLTKIGLVKKSKKCFYKANF
jgi:hypothetical protein